MTLSKVTQLPLSHFHEQCDAIIGCEIGCSIGGVGGVVADLVLKTITWSAIRNDCSAVQPYHIQFVLHC